MAICASAHTMAVDGAGAARWRVGEVDEVFESVARYFSMLSEPVRLRILHVLCHRESSVGEIVVAAGLTQTNVSRHLNLMYQTGVVKRRREGSSIIYSVADASLTDMCRTVCIRVSTELERSHQLKRSVNGLIDELRGAGR